MYIVHNIWESLKNVSSDNMAKIIFAHKVAKWDLQSDFQTLCSHSISDIWEDENYNFITSLELFFF